MCKFLCHAKLTIAIAAEQASLYYLTTHVQLQVYDSLFQDARTNHQHQANSYMVTNVTSAIVKAEARADYKCSMYNTCNARNITPPPIARLLKLIS